MSVLREYQQTMRREIKRRDAEIASWKQRLESAEAMARLVTEYDHDRGCGGRCYSCECGYDERVCDAATTFLQEQEKQNG